MEPTLNGLPIRSIPNPERLSRQAILKVSRELLEQLLPDFEHVAMLRYGELVNSSLSTAERVASIVEPFHKALKLPSDCRITGISLHVAFEKDLIAFRIESPDFVETGPWDTYPDVQAIYLTQYNFLIDSCVLDFAALEARYDGSDSYFQQWFGPAVETRRIYGPDGSVEVEEGPTLSPTQEGEPGGFLLPYGSEELVEAIKELTAVEVPLGREEGECWRCGRITRRLIPCGKRECLDCFKQPLL